MWIITHVHSGKKFYLISEVKKYTVGRVGSEIVLSDDTSISRSHAVFHITDESLKLEDMGSKYGTYYNEYIDTKTNITKGKAITLKEGDRVLFGALKNEWLVSKPNITTMVSSLSALQLNKVKTHLNSLGGQIITEWEPRCTHLTMSEITITIKVLQALIEKIPIVSCEYWKDYLKDLREMKQPPKTSLYLPKMSALLSSAIDVSHFNFNDKRKKLFAEKTFVFMSRKHLNMYSPIVVKAGGQCRDLTSNISKSYLLQKDVVVIHYVASTQSQGSQTINTISEYLEANSLRTVPDYEIGLAIVCCTIEKYCNPSYNTILHILPNSADISPNIGTILAENTRPQKSQYNTLELSNVEIPDSDCLTEKTGPRKPPNSEVYEDLQLESAVITVENSEDAESSFHKTNKRIRDESDENGKEIPTSKRINTLGRDRDNCVINSSDRKSKNKRKSQPATSDSESDFAKKAYISPPFDANKCKQLDIIKTVSTGSLNIENQQIVEKTVPQTKTKYSGFLQKSQINHSQRQVQAASNEPIGNKSGPIKRGRIARITDNDSDNEDDIFNFSSSPKRSKASDLNSENELFGFGTKSSEDTVDDAKNNEEVLAQTQPFILKDKLNSKMTVPKMKVSRLKAASDGWLSKLNILKIKSEDNAEVKKEDDLYDSKHTEWIDSIKDGFEVRVRKMDLSSKGSSLCTAHDPSNSTTKRNFKAFIKKHNYKPQTLIIRTIPIAVPPVH